MMNDDIVERMEREVDWESESRSTPVPASNVSEGLLSEFDQAIQWADQAGPKATVWGPGDVTYRPQPVVIERDLADRLRAALARSTPGGLDAAIDKCIALGCIRMHWGATRPCDEYGDGRELCGPCALRVASQTDATEEAGR